MRQGKFNLKNRLTNFFRTKEKRMYKVSVKFDRINKNGTLEMSLREGTVEAPDRDTARDAYLAKFAKNEPECTGIHWIKVVNMETGKLE
jgi:hypothetical protein